MSTLIPVPNKRRQNHLAALRRTSVNSQNSQNSSSPAVTLPVSYNYNSNSRASSPALSQRSSISYSSSSNGNLSVNKNNSDFCQVTVRIRPFTANEWNLGNTIPVWEGNEELSTVSYTNEWLEKSNKNQLSYQYDNVIVGSDNKELYNCCVKNVVMSSMEGLNGTVFAYGQTASGKTYSMMGSTDSIKISQLAQKKATSDVDRRKEGAFINKSLLTLGNVISKLTEEKRGHIPYRDSKLTRILQSSLSGNAKISVICTISPAGINADESHNTLNFAKRVKKVATKAHTNQVLDDKALIQKYKKEINELKVKLQVATDMSNISTVASLEDDKKDEELMLLQQERIKWEEEMHEQQLLRTALQERIDHLTKLILTSSSISPQMMLEFSKTPAKYADGNKASLLSPLNISENELPPYIEEALSKQTGQLEKFQKEVKAKDEYIKEFELMLQEGKYLDMLTPDANEISMNEQSKNELAIKIKENKKLIIENENNKKIIEDLIKKNKDLKLLVTQQDAKLSSYSANEKHASDFNVNNINLSTPGISPEAENLLEDQQHSLELLEEENKQLKKALNQNEIKLKNLKLIQLGDIEKLVMKTCGNNNKNNNNNNNTNTNNNNTIPTSTKKPPLNLTLSSLIPSNTKSSNGDLITLSKNEISMQNPSSPTKRYQSSTIYNSINNNIHSNNEGINTTDKENYYTMIIQELQANLEEERKKQEEMNMNKWIYCKIKLTRVKNKYIRNFINININIIIQIN